MAVGVLAAQGSHQRTGGQAGTPCVPGLLPAALAGAADGLTVGQPPGPSAAVLAPSMTSPFLNLLAGGEAITVALLPFDANDPPARPPSACADYLMWTWHS